MQLYQSIWRTLYFAPFMGSQAERLMALSFSSPPAPRLRACLQVLEDVFNVETVATAAAILHSGLDHVQESVTRLAQDSQQLLRRRVASWMSEMRGSHLGEWDKHGSALRFARYLRRRHMQHGSSVRANDWCRIPPCPSASIG
ncbi:uncharacterized protein ISCGN_020752 [Ixodes scapularis]